MILEKVIIGIAIFISYFLQTSVDFLRIRDIKPDFILILTVYFSMIRGPFAGIWVGFFGGLLQDINLGGITLAQGVVQYYIGTHSLPKALIGYFSGKFSKEIHQEGSVVYMVVIFIATLLHGLIMFFEVALFHDSTSAQAIATIVLPEAVYNAILAVIWFRVLRWAIPPLETRQGF